MDENDTEPLEGMEFRYQHAALALLRAAKNLSKHLPEVSGNREICDARRVIEHYEVRLKELERRAKGNRHVNKRANQTTSRLLP